MKPQVFFNIIMILLVTVSLSSCAVVGDIFEAGMWIGVIGVVLVVALVFWIFSKFFR
jgi:uncharacterized MnhB-related membrane protein